jgi:hypothetical protein
MGVGLTFELRDKVWANRGDYLGSIISYKYQEVGGKDRPRQPKFMGFRGERDIPPEKLQTLRVAEDRFRNA